jgi:hypothetical protein
MFRIRNTEYNCGGIDSYIVQAVLEVMEALTNMADIMAELWPLDNTARILLRILIHYKFATGLRDNEAERCRIISEFCDAVLRENASRAVGREPPLSFRQAKERWADIAERYYPLHGRAGRQDGRGLGGGGVGSGGGGGSGGSSGGGGGGAGGQPAARGGALAKNRSARYLLAGRSYAVCFDYNRGVCNRKPSGCGCEDSKGIVYAHVCNFYYNVANKHCLAQHARVGNH